MIYASPKSTGIKYDEKIPFSNAAFALERSACAVFGFPTFGVHLTGMLTFTYVLRWGTDSG
jgi:hypothetical protein